MKRAIPTLLIPLLISSIAQAQSLDELYEKAKAEQGLVLYGAGPTGSHATWIKDFQQRYPGVAVSFSGGLSTDLNRKLEQQLATGRMETDLAILQTIGDFIKWKRAGLLLPFKVDGFDRIDPAYKDEDGAFTTVSVNLITYAYNTTLVSSDEIPRSAVDFLKPFLQGKLITTDPTEDDAALAAFNNIVEKYGWSYMDGYMAQKPSFVRNGHAAVSAAIAAGDKLASFDSTSTTFHMQREGKPIAALLSQADKTPVFLVSAAILKNAPHPNAAKLYLNWYLAPEQQRRTGTFSARSDVPPPPGFKPLSSYDIDAGYRSLLSDETRVAELRKRFTGFIRP